MKIRLDKLIEDLRQHVIQMGNMVNESAIYSTQALFDKDRALAQTVVDRDKDINALENLLDEKSLKIFALQQPLAIDLRFVTMVLKMTNDFERIGDLSVNISERVLDFISHDYYSLFSELTEFNELKDMNARATEMVKKATLSIVERDSKTAREVIDMDNEVDDFNKKIICRAIEKLSTHSEQAQFYVNIISISKNLERIADHATNICQDVVFMVEGINVKHTEM